jgi:hypothetical protein
LKEREFMAAARASGQSSLRIISAEILPNEVSLIASTFIGTFVYAVLCAGLTFINFGIDELANPRLRAERPLRRGLLSGKRRPNEHYQRYRIHIKTQYRYAANTGDCCFPARFSLGCRYLSLPDRGSGA